MIVYMAMDRQGVWTAYNGAMTVEEASSATAIIKMTYRLDTHELEAKFLKNTLGMKR